MSFRNRTRGSQMVAWIEGERGLGLAVQPCLVGSVADLREVAPTRSTLVCSRSGSHWCPPSRITIGLCMRNPQVSGVKVGPEGVSARSRPGAGTFLDVVGQM